MFMYNNNIIKFILNLLTKEQLFYYFTYLHKLINYYNISFDKQCFLKILQYKNINIVNIQFFSFNWLR